MSYTVKTASYDKVNDVLYIHFTNIPSSNSYDEEFRGLLIEKDIDTDEITGLTVFFPKREELTRTAELGELGFQIQLMELIR